MKDVRWALRRPPSPASCSREEKIPIRPKSVRSNLIKARIRASPNGRHHACVSLHQAQRAQDFAIVLLAAIAVARISIPLHCRFREDVNLVDQFSQHSANDACFVGSQ